MSKNKDQMPDAAEFGLLRAFLAQKGVKQAQIAEWIGSGANGRTRGEIADELKAHLKELPKANGD